MSKINLTVNKKNYSVDVDPDTPLLWVLRDTLGLTGTKYGCGEGICGSCTVHVDGNAERSCILSVKNVEGSEITTIEGLAENPDHPIFKTWIDLEVSQCGYCQPGQIMTLAAMLNKNASKSEIENEMSSVLCRCGTYHRIRKAVDKLVEGK
ncbi:(2Fe-2S)-binding protein [Stygiobacter electus]|uniref:(2Fe-2S)-binding protein n=1 Tax=Stygiobacter electus TaxID=3032292 RepID=A0AAE3TCN6_9BACT|nr:(2Fe-2S)-binding protein [Stygiobacter electus]MDF1612613.1 (2Fe-2S)-binding protein [Stygiobacter electus]